MSDTDDKPLKEVARVEVKRITPDELVFKDDFLRGCELVKALGEEAAAALLRRGVPRRYSSAARILVADDIGESLYLVLKGEVRLVFNDTGAELATRRRGEVFGAERERTFSAVADGDVDVLELPKAAVDEASKSVPKLSEYLSAVAEKHASACAEMDDFLKRW